MDQNPDLVRVNQDSQDLMDLLAEWYNQWAKRDDMPHKMADALHMRTLLVLLEAGRIDPDTALAR